MQKSATKIGSRSAAEPQDIVLDGLGIQPKHAVIHMENDKVNEIQPLLCLVSYVA